MNLKEYLTKIGKRRTLWAKEHGIPPSVVSKVINGKTRLKLATAIRISEATNHEVSLKELSR